MKVPLLEYLDKLEATAKESGNPNYRPDDGGPAELLLTSKEYRHILATQPRATLALIHATRVLTLTIRKFCENHQIDTSDPELCHVFEIEVPE